MITMKTNARDGDDKILKSCFWILLESIYCLSKMTKFILPLSNISLKLHHIYLLLQITIQEGILDIQLEQGSWQIDNNRKQNHDGIQPSN